jgi:hypothetical protein
MRHNARPLSVPLALLAAFVALTPSVHAQSAQDVFEQMLEAYSRNAEGVDNYTIVQQVLGFETVQYFEKTVVDGRPVFQLQQTQAMGFTGGPDDGGDMSAMYLMEPEFAERARYDGREQIEGREMHVLVIDDLSGLDFDMTTGPEGGDFVPRSMRMLVDTERLTPRLIESDGDMITERGPQEVTSVVEMLDYREVDGFLTPHRMVIRVEGLAEAMDPEMRVQYEEMQRQLENVPESQRAMVEQMMGGALQQMEAMMAGDGDGMTMEVTVTEVRVNSGPPGR